MERDRLSIANILKTVELKTVELKTVELKTVELKTVELGQGACHERAPFPLLTRRRVKFQVFGQGRRRQSARCVMLRIWNTRPPAHAISISIKHTVTVMQD
jgi:hypothetical protein